LLLAKQKHGTQYKTEWEWRISHKD
jgi:hypothetical protein